MDNNFNKSEITPDISAAAGDRNTRRQWHAPRLAWHTPVVKELKVSTHTLRTRRGVYTYDDFFSYTS